VTGGLLLAKIYEEAGLPLGLFTVVIGSGSDIGDPFVEHSISRVISFTGSTEIARHIVRHCSAAHAKFAASSFSGLSSACRVVWKSFGISVGRTMSGLLQPPRGGYRSASIRSSISCRHASVFSISLKV
jgi:Aldehyde dehydrogenase family